MSVYLLASLRERLHDADDRRCAYCHTSEANTGQPMTVDHIVPTAQGGDTAFENLCFACRRCNELKGSQTEAVDPVTTERWPLFHPRRDTWRDHFVWDSPATQILGRTAVGRATVVALAMNNSFIMDARRRWSEVDWHPPAEDL